MAKKSKEFVDCEASSSATCTELHKGKHIVAAMWVLTQTGVIPTSFN